MDAYYGLLLVCIGKVWMLSVSPTRCIGMVWMLLIMVSYYCYLDLLQGA